ncbi:KIF-binding protein [Aplysia californica]|uniref:KIF-binding protein n=1 Tax=Aplysia californica TaxID=6500 RepID=A0ABM0JHG3_APLCA|nr:KIF-binding protein [Aplysia californica]
MATLEKCLGPEGAELYKQARFLAEEESKKDPEEEPFRSKYKARELYDEINRKVLDKLSVERGDETNKRAFLALSLCLELNIGILHMDTEELAEGEDKFMSCLKRIEEDEFQGAVSLHINVLNHLGILWTGRNSLDKALEFLVSAEKRYHSYKQNVGGVPQSFLEHLRAFDGNEDSVAQQRSASFESLHTHTLYYLAQVYAKQEKSSLSAHYCLMTLHRQLAAGDYNPVDWGLNAATLSQYFLTAEKFMESRHCLASGSLIYENSLKNVQELSEDENDLQSQRSADIDRCWIKYGLALLEVSRDKMLSELEDMEEPSVDVFGYPKNKNDHNSDKQTDPTSDKQTESNTEVKSSEKDFETFDLELTVYEEQVTDKLVRIFDDARKVFLFIVGKIKSAITYYSLDGHASDAVEITQDHSKAYKLLAFFELDFRRQCQMHKRRVDMLSELLSELNPQYYLLVNRQLMYEIAETYSTMVDLKVTAIELSRTQATPYNTSKINKLVQQSIDKYQEYIDSLKGGKPELPPEFPEGDVRPALVAFFCMGRLYTKFLEPNVPQRLALMAKSLACYKFVVDYCAANESAVELVKSEIDICKEMVNLVPLKMERLRSQQES